MTDPRADNADMTLLVVLMDAIHEQLGPRCADFESPADRVPTTTCFELAYELTLQGWTLPKAP